MKKNLALIFLAVGIVAVCAALLFRATAPEVPETTPTPTPEANIIVTSPTADAEIGSPFLVNGQARVFENTFDWRLRNDAHIVIAEGFEMANAPDAGQFGPFSFKIIVPAGEGPELLLEVFDYSAKDGSVQDMVRIPLRLSNTETSQVKVYFNSSVLDPEITCEKVFPVERTITSTKEVAYVALMELLKGVAIEEQANGYSSALPDGVRLRSIIIRNGTAYADFDATLEYQVGGSCRVGVIRRQIVETLEQFPSIFDVVISIDGRTEDILQP